MGEITLPQGVTHVNYARKRTARRKELYEMSKEQKQLRRAG